MVPKIEELRLTQFLMCCLDLSVGIECHKYMFLICFRPISSFIQTWLSFFCFSWRGWFSGSQEQNCKLVNHMLTILIHHFFPGLFLSCYILFLRGDFGRTPGTTKSTNSTNSTNRWEIIWRRTFKLFAKPVPTDVQRARMWCRWLMPFATPIWILQSAGRVDMMNSDRYDRYDVLLSNTGKSWKSPKPWRLLTGNNGNIIEVDGKMSSKICLIAGGWIIFLGGYWR